MPGLEWSQYFAPLVTRGEARNNINDIGYTTSKCMSNRNPQTWNWINQQTVKESPPAVFITRPRPCPEGARRPPQHHHHRVLHQAHDDPISCSLLLRRRASSRIKLAMHLMLCRSRHSAINQQLGIGRFAPSTSLWCPTVSSYPIVTVSHLKRSLLQCPMV